MEIGFAVCGSFCTYSIVFPVMEQLSREHHVTPIFSDAAYSVDSRFGTAREHIVMAETICGTPPLHTLAQVEPVGPKKLFDILIIAPWHRKYPAKLAHSIADTPVTMAAKSHLRNGRPVLNRRDPATTRWQAQRRISAGCSPGSTTILSPSGRTTLRRNPPAWSRTLR